MSELKILFAGDDHTVDQIIDLQRKNLRKNLSPEEISSQGFVFVEHDPITLKKICATEPAVIARDGDTLAGYAICMNKAYGVNVPELVDLFQHLDAIVYNGNSLKDSNYLVCGQLCVAKGYRGQNLAGKLYGHMSLLNRKYPYCVTDVSDNNQRSLHAHLRRGFEIIKSFTNDQGELWHIVLWDWNKNQEI